MNTLPRWFGRGRKKKASCDSSEPKPPEIVWLKEAEGAAHQTGTSSGSDTKLDLSSPDDDEDFHGLMSATSEMPPGLEEVAEAKRKLLRKAASVDALDADLANPVPPGFLGRAYQANNESDTYGGYLGHSYQNITFNPKVQNRPLPMPGLANNALLHIFSVSFFEFLGKIWLSEFFSWTIFFEFFS